MTATLQIQLFGGLRVALDGVPIRDFYSIKAPALLAYLAVTRRTPTRDALAALLWGEMSDVDAKTNLRQAFASLRKHLEPYLLITRDTAEFNFDAPYLLDVEQFETKFREENLSEAVALYKGDFLDGVFVRDAPEFEEWAIAQRARLRELALQAFHKLTQQHARRGEYARGIDYATRLLALDPWREETHRELMLMLARTGQRSVALQQYEICKRELHGQMGVEPSTETTALYERIRAAGEAVPNHLPPQPTSFVGRVREFAQIEAALLKPECRLITLLGAGGVGKTRLALQAAERALKIGAFLNGVYFVSLSDVDSPALLAPAMADAVGFTFSGKPDPQTQLANFLHEKEMLFVLDNFEHLLDAATWLSQLLTSAPRVKILVTSRERLNLQREWLVVVEGLDYPNGAGIADAHQFTAVQLFIERARQVRPDFELNDATRAGVARVCQLVEGMPLAIELAAAWAQTYSVDEITRTIERGYDFLATTQRDVPERQRSLRVVFDHSWQLLSALEREVFQSLAVFRGGFTHEAAAAITTCPLPVLAALCDKSLIRRDVNGRYSIHELLRQYADGKLRAEPPQFAEAQARHCEYYIGFLGAREDAQNDARQNEARREIATEIDNIRAAWGWAVAQPQPDVLEPALESLRVFLENAGWYTEAVKLFGSAVEAERAFAGDGNPLLGKLLARQAWFYHRLDRFEAARPLIQQSQMIFRNAQPPLPAEEALCLQCLGNMTRMVGDFDQAMEYSRQSLSLHRVAGNPRAIAASLNALGTVHTERGEFEKARRLQEESLAIKREIGDRRGMAVSLVNLGTVALGQGKYVEAKPFEREALAVFREIGYPMGVAVALNNLGVACYMLEEYAEARLFLQECLALCRELGHRHIAAHTLANLGGVAGALGEYREAWQNTREALQMAAEVGSVSATLVALVSAAVLVARQEERERAAEVAALVFHHAAANRETKDRAEKLLVELEAQLPAPIMVAAQERGRARQLEAVVAEMLQI